MRGFKEWPYTPKSSSSSLGTHRLLAADDVARIDTAADLINGDRETAYAAFVSVAFPDTLWGNSGHFLSRLFYPFLLCHAFLLSSKSMNDRCPLVPCSTPLLLTFLDLVEFKPEISNRKLKFHQDRCLFRILRIPNTNNPFSLFKRSERSGRFETDRFHLSIDF